MTGIVVVSHSRELARSVAELAKEMVSGEDLPLAFAGGVSGEDGAFGTDATDIMAAIESVAGGDGVLLLVDMGSAILSAEMAVELLGADPESVRICAAPLVEGTMAAAVAASMGQSLEQVAREAAGALLPKMSQLSDGSASVSGSDADTAVAGSAAAGGRGISDSSAGAVHHGAESAVFRIDLKHGLHARPVSKLIRELSSFEVDATVSNLSKVKGPVSGSSLNQISTLEVTRGDEILVRTTGPDARAALEAVRSLVADHFGETEEEPAVEKSRRRPDGMQSLSPGYAIGPPVIVDEIEMDVPKRTVDDPAAERVRFDSAIARVEEAIQRRIDDLSLTAGSVEAEIFEAHQALVRDPDLVDVTRDAIEARREAAEFAWSQAIGVVVGRYGAMSDSYLQVRATDFRDIGAQVLAELDPASYTGGPVRLDGDPSVVCARELTPSQTVGLDPGSVAAIVTEQSGATSHTAILARALGIPAVGGVRTIDTFRQASCIAVDAFAPEVLVDPSPAVRTEFEGKLHAWSSEQQRLRDGAQQPADTLDGLRIDVFANIAGESEVQSAIANGAEGVGLYRTEFMYVDRNDAPSIDEQMTILTGVFRKLEGRPIVVRTFDIGGDKKIPYFSIETEENPFLGVRGIRLYDEFPEIFTAHIEAILRAAVGHDVSIMFPMVSKVDELSRVRAIAESIHERLRLDGIEHVWPVPIGVMIETPASVLIAEQIAEIADFFSIGTNDLTQYILAAERGSRRLAGFLDSMEPSVLRAVGQIAQIGADRGIPVSVCGEIGAQIEAIPLLLGLGITKISAGGSSIPAIKDAVRRVRCASIRQTVQTIVREARSAREVRARLQDQGL